MPWFFPFLVGWDGGATGGIDPTKQTHTVSSFVVWVVNTVQWDT